MPEVLTKYPDVVKKVLESAGAKCGEGLPQKILKECPKDAFCALPGGEQCVYGVAQVGKMTQIEESDLAKYVCNDPAGCAASAGADGAGALAMAALLLGIAIGRVSKARPSDRRRTWRRPRCRTTCGSRSGSRGRGTTD